MRGSLLASLLALGLSAPFCNADADALAEDVRTLNAAHLGTDVRALLDLFKKHTLTGADRARLRLLIKQLGDDDFDVREKAGAALIGLGSKALAPLRMALNDRDAEVAHRAADCLHKLMAVENPADKVSPTCLVAAVRLLASRKPAGAVEVLLNYVPGAEQEALVEEIETALAALASLEGKTEPALIAALTAPDTQRRGSAGAALARAGCAGHKKAVRLLLDDPDLGVRLRVGLALARSGDKTAVPVLIDLLGKLPPNLVWPVEQFLQLAAGEQSPSVNLGSDAASRELCRAAWAAWWREHGAVGKLPALDANAPLLGYTLVVIPDFGQVLEVDRAGKTRWQVNGLQSPFHAQMLPGNRVLVAESGGVVTERDFRGKIYWEKKFDNVEQCQRLPNGNTFVVTWNKLYEVEPTGKQTVVYTHKRPGSVMLAARKLRNGQIVIMENDSGGTCVRIDATGKELVRFPVGKISNNSLEVLPNGNILVPKYFDNKITEYDPQGKIVAETPCPSAFSAYRLPNGNTVVSCYQSPRVIEINRTGEIVWEHKLESLNHRPWFASRR